jgi:phosphoserine phosphatase RsbU/P
MRKLAAAILVILFEPTLIAQTFDLEASRQAVVSLDGKWRFHPGNDPHWADPAFDDSSWPLLDSTRSWSDQGYKNMSGDAWYRFTVRAPAGGQPLSVLLGYIFTGYEVYLDGRRIGQSGAMPGAIFIHRPRLAAFPLQMGPRSTPRILHFALHVWHSPVWAGYAGGGTYGGGSMIGDAQLIAGRLQMLNTSGLMTNVDLYVSAVLRGFIGLVILGLFCLRPGEREYLWFAAIQLFGCADDALNFAHLSFASIPIQIFDLIDTSLAAGFWISGLLFVASILSPKRGFWFRLSLALALLSPLATPPYWFGWLPVPVAGALGSMMVLPSLVWVIALLVRRAWQHDADALLLVVPVVLVDGFYLAWNTAVDVYQLGWIHSYVDLFDFSVPFKPFGVRLYTVFNVFYLLALLAFLIRRFTLARRKEEQLQSQLEAASQVQKMLVPESAPPVPGFNIEAVYLPAESVGGDFFQHMQDGRGGLLVVVGDVAGKGLPAAMMVSMLVGTLRAEAQHSSDPAALLNVLNERMLERSQGGFATCLVLHVDADGLCTLANAGHIPPYHNGKEIEVQFGLPLGILAGAEYFEETFALDPGNSLTLLTDGVVEARNPDRELFGFDRAAAISTQPAEEIARAAQAFGQQDDITVLTLTFVPAEVLHA